MCPLGGRLLVVCPVGHTRDGNRGGFKDIEALLSILRILRFGGARDFRVPVGNSATCEKGKKPRSEPKILRATAFFSEDKMLHAILHVRSRPR